MGFGFHRRHRICSRKDLGRLGIGFSYIELCGKSDISSLALQAGVSRAKDNA